MPRVKRTLADVERVSAQDRAAATYRAERRVQAAEGEIDTVSGAIPADLEASLVALDSRITALEP